MSKTHSPAFNLCEKELEEIYNWTRAEIDGAHKNPLYSDKLIKIIGDNMQNLIRDIANYADETEDETTKLPSHVILLKTVIESMTVLMHQHNLTPLTGEEYEWKDVTAAEDVGKICNITFRGNTIKIPIESIQQNKRCSFVFRYNNDNNLAHNIRGVIYCHDDGHSVTSTTLQNDDSLRFVKFPYMPAIIPLPIKYDQHADKDNTCKTYEEIPNLHNGYGYQRGYTSADRIIFPYPGEISKNYKAYLVAPKIPFTTFEEYGIDIDKEVKEYYDFLEEYSTMG